MSHKKIPNLSVLVQEYQAGASSDDLARLYQTSRNVITNSLRRAGCAIRARGESQKLRFVKLGHPMMGRSVSEETREKMRANHADFSGDKNPNFSKGLHGSSNPNWKGGVSLEGSKGRNTSQHFLWKGFVFKRDSYTCQLCSTREFDSLISHHIRNWRTHKELRFDIDNGITLCNRCHGTVSRDEEKYALLFDELIEMKK